MACDVTDRIHSLFRAYNALVDKCCAGNTEKIEPDACAITAIFQVYDNTTWLLIPGSEKCPDIKENPFSPDPGKPGQSLTVEWLTQCEAWIKGITCVPVAEGMYLIYIGNENTAKDDNYEVFLNGVSIGEINMEADGVCNGGLWSVADLSSADTITDWGGCWADIQRFSLSPDLFTAIGNTLVMRNTKLNHNGNWGVVRVVSVTPTALPGVYEIVNTYLSDAYSGGDGADFSFVFDLVIP